jgi:hypothetical protein
MSTTTMTMMMMMMMMMMMNVEVLLLPYLIITQFPIEWESVCVWQVFGITGMLKRILAWAM